MVTRALLAVLLAASAGAAHAGGTQLMISAVVAKSARINTYNHPATLQVTEADVARGYVELPAGTRIETWSNSREGLALSLFASGAFAWSANFVVPGGSQRVDLRYRLPLDPAVQPGTYPWPVQVVATPL